MKLLIATIFLWSVHTIGHNVTIPATNGLVTQENIFLYFPSLDNLKEAVVQPVMLTDNEVGEKVLAKLAPIVNRQIYPSQLAHLIFELAFLDAEPSRLTIKQRTDNVGYVLSNLGRGEAKAIEQLFAFYYGYSFEYFAAKRS